MMTMDLQTILIGLGVFVISALLIYLFMTVMMRETTFEQVMEEQKRNQEVAQWNRPKEPKKDKKKKFKKGKTGDKGAAEAEKKDNVFKERKMVELEIDPEYIEGSDSGSTSTPPSKKSKAAKVKPILTNKEEKVIVVKEAPDLVHRKNVPKDVLELKHEHEQHQARNGKEESATVKVPEATRLAAEVKKLAEVSRVVEPASVPEAQKLSSSSQPVAKKEASKKKKALRDISEEAALEVMEKTTTVKLAAAPPPATELVNGCEPPLKSSKKTRNFDQADAEFVTGEVNNLLASVQLAQLTDTDIQSLIDALIAKLSNQDLAKAFDWTKKGHKADPITQLRRQVEEKERALEEEQQRNLSGSAKIKELNQELMNERQKFASLANMNQEQNVEIQAMQARMQESHAQHMSELNVYRSQLEAKTKQANEGLNQIQRLKEENKILQDAVAKTQHLAGAEKTNDELRQKVNVLDSALQQISKQLNAAENAKKANESKAKQYEERIHEMEASVRESQAMAQRYKDLSDDLHKSESRMNSLTVELEKQVTALRRAEDEKNGYLAELKNKENQMNELKGRVMLTNSKLEELLKSGEQKEAELQGLKAELQESRNAVRETSASQQQSSNWADGSEMMDQANEQLFAEKDEALRTLNAQLDEKLRQFEMVTNELGDLKKRCSDLEAEKNSLQMSLQEKVQFTSNKSEEQNVELDELRKANAKLEAELWNRSQELTQLHSRLEQKDAEHEKVKHESSARSQELSRLVNELLQKDAELAKANNEVDGLRKDNAVLSECRVQCEELKNSLVMLSEQLELKEAKQAENEAMLVELREKESKWFENEASAKALETRLAEKDAEVEQLRKAREENVEERNRVAEAERQEVEKRLEESELQLNELRQREAAWLEQEAKLAETVDRLKQLSEVESKLAVADAKLHQLKENEAKHAEVVADLKSTLEATEASLAERDVQVRQLQETNFQVVETELQLMEMRQKSAELQKLSDKYGSLEELNRRLSQLSAKEARLTEVEAREAASEARLRQIEEELLRSKTQLDDTLHLLSVEETARNEQRQVVESVSTGGDTKPQETSGHREVTVFTRVQEKAAWDMSKLVLDLDTKEAEIQILQSILSQKESTVEELEADKTRLMDMIENMQMELWAKDKQIKDAEAKNNNKSDDIAEELAEARLAQSSLQAEVVHYQTILADTERILKQLENNVDNEEQKWRQKYETAIEEKDKLQEELTKLRNSENIESNFCLQDSPNEQSGQVQADSDQLSASQRYSD